MENSSKLNPRLKAYFAGRTHWLVRYAAIIFLLILAVAIFICSILRIPELTSVQVSIWNITGLSFRPGTPLQVVQIPLVQPALKKLKKGDQIFLQLVEDSVQDINVRVDTVFYDRVLGLYLARGYTAGCPRKKKNFPLRSKESKMAFIKIFNRTILNQLYLDVREHIEPTRIAK